MDDVCEGCEEGRGDALGTEDGDGRRDLKGNYELWILNFELRDKKAIMKGKLGTEPLFFWRQETGKIGDGRRETGGR